MPIQDRRTKCSAWCGHLLEYPWRDDMFQSRTNQDSLSTTKYCRLPSSTTAGDSAATTKLKRLSLYRSVGSPSSVWLRRTTEQHTDWYWPKRRVDVQRSDAVQTEQS